MSAILPLALEMACYKVGGEILLDAISHRFEAGSPTLIIGPNGAGKSLLLRLCDGLITPTTGAVTWHGPQAAAPKRYTSFAFQKPTLLRRSVLDNVAYPLTLRGDSTACARQKATRALESAGLAPLANRRASVLSGGEQQRLAIARAWVTQPEVLFLDEPTASLDPRATRDIEELIGKIQASGTKIIMTSHDMAQVRRLAADIIFLHNGKLVETGAAANLLDAPKHKLTAAFLRGELTV